VDESTADPCVGDLTFNFDGARPRGGNSLVFREETGVSSPSGGYAYVTRRGEDELILNLEGEVFVGMFVDAGTLNVAWSSADEDRTLVEYQEDYRFEGVETRMLDQQFELTAEGDLLTGTMTVIESEALVFTETDEWDAQQSGIAQSDIPAFTYLERIDGEFGFVSNDAAAVDCAAADCELSVSETCTSRLTVTAYPIEGGFERFEALVGFQRPGGVPTTGFP
ncbi:MAG: hypothetical protein AAF602_18710, partial [Myxococcota bacterium]